MLRFTKHLSKYHISSECKRIINEIQSKFNFSFTKSERSRRDGWLSGGERLWVLRSRCCGWFLADACRTLPCSYENIYERERERFFLLITSKHRTPSRRPTGCFLFSLPQTSGSTKKKIPRLVHAERCVYETAVVCVCCLHESKR